MSEALSVPAPAAATPLPGTAPPGTAPPGDAANAFLAALLASGLATAPPPGPVTSVRTAVAEDAPAGGDSSGQEAGTATTGGSPLPPNGLVTMLPLATPPVQKLAQPAATGQAQQGPVNAIPAGLVTPAPAHGPVVDAPSAEPQPIVKAPPLSTGAPAPEQDAPAGGPMAGPVKAPAPAERPALDTVAPTERPTTAQPPAATTRPAGDPPAAVPTQHGHQADPEQTPGHGQPGGRQPAPGEVPVPATAARSDAAPTQTVTAPTVQPVSTVAVEAPKAPDAPATLRELPEAFRTAVRVAVHEGNTSARIALRPDHLGHVEIRLSYDSTGGVTAHVTADSHAAAAALTAQAPDLRRSLEAQGLTVLGLDIQQSGVDAGTTPDRGPGFGQQAHRHGSRHAGEGTEETATLDVTSLPLAAGQVNVLA